MQYWHTTIISYVFLGRACRLKVMISKSKNKKPTQDWFSYGQDRAEEVKQSHI